MTLAERFDILSDKYCYKEEKYLEKKEFIETFCSHPVGPLVGQKFILADFMCEDILKPAFGLYTDSSCRKRLIKQVYVQTPKSNSKSTFLACIELAVLFNDGQKNAQIYNCAGVDKQAGILCNYAGMME